MKNYLRLLTPMMLLLAVVFGGGKSLAQTTETYNFSNFDTSASVTFSGKNCTIVFAKNNGATNPAWVSNQARIYPKGSITVSSTKKIVKIVYNYAVNKKNGTAPTIDSVTPDGFDEAKNTWSSTDGSNSVEMILGGSKGNFGFTSLEITYAAEEGDSKTSTSISFPKMSYEFTVGEDVGTFTNAAVLTPSEAGVVTYSSDNEDVAVVDETTGEVYVVTDAVGKATITASFSGNADYKASSAYYTIIVSKVQTTTALSFGEAYDGKTVSVELSEGFTAPTATLTPSIEGATIKYTSSKTSVAIVDEATGVVTLKGVGTTVITATYDGDDDYVGSTASYTIKVVGNGFSFTTENNSFKNISEIGGSGYKKGTVAFVDESGSSYDFTLTDCMLQNDNLQMKAKTGNIVSPLFNCSYGYNVVVKYSSDTEMTLTADGKTATGSNGEVSLNTTSDVAFTLETGSKYSKVSSIVVTPNPTPKTETLTTAASGYATYFADYATNYSEAGLTAFTVKVNGDKVVATEYTGVVPAGAAVLVKGDASKAYTLAPATEAAGEFATDLLASDGSVTSDGASYFAFSSKGTKGFKLVGNDVTIPAKKGYLKVEGAAGANFLSFDDETTGINTVEAAAAADGKAYNMAGQRVSKAYKGLVIIGGKKYLNK